MKRTSNHIFVLMLLAGLGCSMNPASAQTGPPIKSLTTSTSPSQHKADSSRANPPKALHEALLKKFPKDSDIDGRWVYFPEIAGIEELAAGPEINKVIPQYRCYRIMLTNMLGYHVNKSSNLILFDSRRSTIVHAVPMWYGDISPDLLKLFIGKKFPDSASLLNFTHSLQNLMAVGSSGRFENTKYGPGKVTFDYVNQTSKGAEVWRNIEMFIENNTIKRFRSTNPIMKTSEEVH